MRALCFTVLAGLPVLLAACNRGGPIEHPPTEILVTATTAQDAAAVQSLELSGQVQSRRQAPLAFRVSGKIDQRFVDAGEKVEEGQVLLSLDATDLELRRNALEAQVESAEAQLNNASEELARHTRMLEKELIGQAQFDRVESQWKQAKAAYDAAVAQQRNARNEVDYSDLKADAPALVTAVLAEEGQVVQAGQPVLRLARLDQLEVEVDVPEDYISRISAGDAVRVNIPALEGQEIEGTIREIAGMADPRTRTYPTRVSLADPGPDVKLGMTADVHLSAPLGGDGVVLPARSIVQGPGGKPAAWVLDDANVAHMQVVQPRVITGDSFIVQGIEPGQRVVVQGAAFIQEPGKVRLVENPSGAPGKSAETGDRTLAIRPFATE